MIDCHIHAGLGKTGLKNKFGISFENPIERAKHILKAYVKLGVQGLRDGGDIKRVGVIFRDVSKDFDLTYRTPIRALYKKGLYGDFLGDPITDQKDAIKKMDALMRESPDFIKIILTGIMSFTEFGVSGAIGFTKEELSLMVEHAHDCGKKVMVHVNTARGIILALEAKADTIEHGYGIEDDCIHALSENNVVWVPTLAPFANIAKCDDDSSLKKFRSVSELYFKKHRQQVKKANAMGVNIALGSDAGASLVFHGQGSLDELGYLLDCGLTKEQLETVGKRVIEIK